MFRDKGKIFLLIPIIVIISGFFIFRPNDKEEKNFVKIGILANLGTTQEEFQEKLDSTRNFLNTSENFSEFRDENPPENFISSIMNEARTIYFHDSLMSALMSMKAGKIDEFMLPENVGNYLMAQNSSYEIRFITDILLSKISFGFRENEKELKSEFDKVIKEIKSDGTLDALIDKYVINFADNRQSIKPETFKDAPTIKVAVTGDMPPVDMFAGDGKPAGFNTAVLSEIGRRLKRNIKFVNVDTGGRTSALFSGRADVVFWYVITESKLEGYDPLDDIFKDVSPGVILSEPYFSWDKEFIIRLKQSKNLF